ncbi:odorant receptor 82a-like [Diachasma alloeum]|uniref:Odorant receptor n=1 Tax=Diachasma alloeum TaxID=454923 RepID=A0A4E0RNM7_9HYME|nr:odorant receptor 82a-like [Diachasma alloeum]THK33036.1 odorant receptor 9 [Diachasma alloeum]
MARKPSKSPQRSPVHDRKANINYELQYTRWLLTVLGIWQLISNNVTRLTKVSSLFLIVLSIFAISFVLIPLVMFALTRVKTLRGRFTFIGPVGFRISNLLKLLTMAYRADVIKECIDQIKSDWLEVIIENEREAMLKSVELGRSLTVICAVFMFSSGTFFHVGMPLLKPRKVNALNVTIRPHLYPGYDVFVDSQASPAYEIIFAAHCFCAAGGYTIVTAACNLAAVFVSHVSGQVEVIRLKLETLHGSGDREEADVSEQIASIVRCHVKILRFSGNIKTVLREICLVEILLSTVVICWLEFYCLTEWHNSETISIVTYFLLLISLTFNIFIYCYIGQILKDQCESVGLMTYLIDWHRIPRKNILSLAFTISMTHYPRTITAGGLMQLTIQSFGDVMKTSLAYLNMLRAVTA